MKEISNRVVHTTGYVKAVLGPTNTGKTHLAVERMLGHSSGMIGLPLRLLAREIYDRVVLSKGALNVALITGEEKIIPAHARYFVCTVEAMPIEKTVEFLAIDEIQLAADFDRGHVFTDRLLRARGRQETMFLGAETVGPLIRRLIPDVEFISRPRFSQLLYVEPKKLSRLPRKTALITFSASNVYGYAEMLRRAKGGVAVVMGSLSPRTRNAQVDLYQNGDVDYIVATDAIGMGLNMDIDHVSFSGISKFDGRQMRDLAPSEIAQIAGRAGRYMNNGTFGCLTEGADYQTGLDPQIVYAVENHQFAPLAVLQWRNSFIDYSRAETVIRSLLLPPNQLGLSRAQERIDLRTFTKLCETGDIKPKLTGPAAVKTLWEVCQIPDFRQVSDDEHITLCRNIYRQVSADNGAIKDDLMREMTAPLDKMSGDIDALSNRIAHIRTWTYVSNRSGWCENQKNWQEITRDIEDRLSDALHQRLTQRFVNRRTSVLMRELRQKGKLMAIVETDGTIYVEDHFIGTLEGFHFKEEAGAFGEDSKILRDAASKVLAQEIKNRAEELNQAEDGELSIIFGDPLTRSTINWRGVVIGRIEKGASILTPRAVVLPTPILQGDALNIVQDKLNRWLDHYIQETLATLFALQEAVNGAKNDDGKELITGMARGVAFQIVEKLGTIPRRIIAKEFKEVDRDGRFQIKQLGVWLGAASLYIPSLLKPAPAQLRLLLWAIYNDQHNLPNIPPAGLCTIKIDIKAPRTFYEVSGYRVVGKNAVRLDMLERLANAAREISLSGPFEQNADLMSLVGTSGDDFKEIMSYLGYVATEHTKEDAEQIIAKRIENQTKNQKGDAPEKQLVPEANQTDARVSSPENNAEVNSEDTLAPIVELTEQKQNETKEQKETADKVIIYTHQPEKIRQKIYKNKPQSADRKKVDLNHKINRPPFKGKPNSKTNTMRHHQKKKNSPEKPLDPDSPFAALAGLRAQLKNKK